MSSLIDITAPNKAGKAGERRFEAELTGAEKNETVPKKSLRRKYFTESLIYHGSGLLLMLGLLSGIDHIFAFTPVDPLLIIIGTVTILIGIASRLTLPTRALVSIRKKRAELLRFLKNEIRFALGLTFVLFFSGMQLNLTACALFLAANFAVQSILFALWRKYNLDLAVDKGFESSPGTKNVIIIGTGDRARRTLDLLMDDRNAGINIIGFVDFHRNGLWRYRDIPLIGNAEELERIVLEKNVAYAMLAAEPGDLDTSQEVFELAERMGVNICVIPDFYKTNVADCHQSSLGRHAMMIYRPKCQGDREVFLKNVTDKAAALLGLIIALPILTAAAIAIKVTSRGPIFFKQKRSGIHGRVFEMYKLRTMYNGADRHKEKLMHLNEMSGPVFKIKNDPRITPVGKILRKFSIDEFPQFFNILMGDMSLVGPRPPLPREVAEYDPWQRRRLSVKPGATCLWQINGRNHVDFDKWVQLDLSYIDNWSLREDLRIIMKTFPAVLRGNGAS